MSAVLVLIVGTYFIVSACAIYALASALRESREYARAQDALLDLIYADQAQAEQFVKHAD